MPGADEVSISSGFLRSDSVQSMSQSETVAKSGRKRKYRSGKTQQQKSVEQYLQNSSEVDEDLPAGASQLLLELHQLFDAERNGWITPDDAATLLRSLGSQKFADMSNHQLRLAMSRAAGVGIPQDEGEVDLRTLASTVKNLRSGALPLPSDPALEVFKSRFIVSLASGTAVQRLRQCVATVYAEQVLPRDRVGDAVTTDMQLRDHDICSAAADVMVHLVGRLDAMSADVVSVRSDQEMLLDLLQKQSVEVDKVLVDAKDEVKALKKQKERLTAIAREQRLIVEKQARAVKTHKSSLVKAVQQLTDRANDLETTLATVERQFQIKGDRLSAYAALLLEEEMQLVDMTPAADEQAEWTRRCEAAEEEAAEIEALLREILEKQEAVNRERAIALERARTTGAELDASISAAARVVDCIAEDARMDLNEALPFRKVRA